jgi:hypothetical protein
MVTHTSAPTFALRPAFDRRLPDRSWWPENRTLSEQLGHLFALWPPEAGRIIRVLYSPPDWDDRPAPVAVPGRRFKTGRLPQDDTHQLTLSLRGGPRRSITVIAPDTPTQNAEVLLAGVEGRHDRPAPRRDDQAAWDNEGGHL